MIARLRSLARLDTPAGRQNLLFWLALIALYVAFRVQYLDMPLNRDEGAFGYIGREILNGKLPYRDLLDHKPPVVFYLYALILAMLPPTSVGIHLFLHGYNFITLILVYLAARDLSGERANARWSALCYAILSASPFVQGYTASTEMFMLLPIMASLVLTLRGLAREKTYLLLLAGSLAALACWTKQVAFFSLLFVFPLLFLIRRGEHPDCRRRLRDAAAWLGGGLLVSAAIVFHFRQVIGEFWYWSFEHGYFYGKERDLLAGTVELLPTLAHLFSGNGPALLFMAAAIAIPLINRNRRPMLPLLFLALSLPGVVPGFGYLHYYAQLVPPLALASGLGISLTLEQVGAGSKRRVRLVVAAALIAWPLISHSEYFFGESAFDIGRLAYGPNPFPESELLAQYIARRSEPDDRVFIFGSEPQILLLAERQSATRFPMLYPLLAGYPRQAEFRQMLLQDLRENVPELVLYVDLPESLLWDAQTDDGFLQRVNRLIATQYRFEGTLPLDLADQASVRDRLDRLPQPDSAPEGENKILIWKRRH